MDRVDADVRLWWENLQGYGYNGWTLTWRLPDGQGERRGIVLAGPLGETCGEGGYWYLIWHNGGLSWVHSSLKTAMSRLPRSRCDQ